MSKQPDNPPAFPMPAVFSPECGTMPGQSGMTIRDWFAGQFIIFSAISAAHQCVNVTPKDIARESYRFSDAMLAERAKPQPRTLVE